MASTLKTMNYKSSGLSLQLARWLLRDPLRNGSRKTVPFNIGIATDVGLTRQHNEDRSAICRGADKYGNSYFILALADGIGGMRDGMECAATAIAALFATVHEHAQIGTSDPLSWLEQGAHASNQIVRDLYEGKGGSTLVAALISEVGKSGWISVGDSRIYAFSEEASIQISKDDTIAGQLGRQRENSSEQSQLLQYIGMQSALDLQISAFDSKTPHRLVLCTDGVYFTSHDAKLLSLITLNKAIGQDEGIVARRLVELSRWAGGPDNSTAIVATLPLDFTSIPDSGSSNLELWDSLGQLYLHPATAIKPRLEQKAQPAADPPNSLRSADNSHTEKVLLRNETVSPETRKSRKAAKTSSKAKRSSTRARKKSGKLEIDDAPTPGLELDFSSVKDD
ncbi:PP2C family protein-serine/threonine phosphatase [Xanthomonas euvesicatoria]|uniref:PP2C family protein-serine/threonine phosphatase n=1 Tax=Xanthomonas euvesicatoria TaxID=456327 RepID=UPI001F461554|nr:protein phosphatase 2C domain-containing protein [Xanthomonas euvesicatoria]